MTDPQESSLGRVDRVGATCSSLCAVHCAATAAVPGALAAMGLGALVGHEAEWAFTVAAILFAAAALVLGWRRHRRVWIGLIFGVGIVGLIASRLAETVGIHSVGHVVGVLSGLALVVGHIASIRVSRSQSEAPVSELQT